jgi:hypothetical protein
VTGEGGKIDHLGMTTMRSRGWKQAKGGDVT